MSVLDVAAGAAAVAAVLFCAAKTPLSVRPNSSPTLDEALMTVGQGPAERAQTKALLLGLSKTIAAPQSIEIDADSGLRWTIYPHSERLA